TIWVKIGRAADFLCEMGQSPACRGPIMSVTIALIVPSALVVRPNSAGIEALPHEGTMKTLSLAGLRNTLGGLSLAFLALSTTGSQGVYNGQTLPSPWYIYDDIQYFAPGPEFKLTREAAAMKAYRADLEAQQRGQ